MMTLEELRKSRVADEHAYKTNDLDLCMLCAAYGADKRSLRISCLYVLKEIGPEFLELDNEYWLRFCKSCRARLLEHLRVWRDECVALRSLPKDHDGYLLDEGEEDPLRTIPYRQGGITIMLTQEEYDKKRGNRSGAPKAEA